VKRMLQALALLWLAFAIAAPASADVRRRVPGELDPAKAYVLVEIRNQDDGRQRGNIVLARYDSAGRDVRGGTRSPDSALGPDVPVRVSVRSNAIARGEKSRLYLLEV
jgi:hypothetical protein